MEQEGNQRDVPLGSDSCREAPNISNIGQSEYLISSDSFDYSLFSKNTDSGLELSWSDSINLSTSWETSEPPYNVHQNEFFPSPRPSRWSPAEISHQSGLNGSFNAPHHWETWSSLEAPSDFSSPTFDRLFSSYASQGNSAVLESSQSSLHSEPRIKVKDDPFLIQHSHRPREIPNIRTQDHAEDECTYPTWIKPERTYGPLVPANPRTLVEEQSKTEKKHRCDACEIGFSQRKNLDRHRSTIHAGGASKKECHHISCDKTFLRHDNLIAHLRRYHGDHIAPTRAATFPNLSPNSTSCSSRFADSHARAPSDGLSPSALNSPRFNRPKHRSTTFTCEMKHCTWHEKSFRSLSDLRRHERDVHRRFTGPDNNNGYICASEHCPLPGKTWSRLDNLRNHIHKIHKDEAVEDLITRSSVPRMELPARDNKSPAFVFYTDRLGR